MPRSSGVRCRRWSDFLSIARLNTESSSGCPLGGHGSPDRLIHLGVAGTAAEISAEGVADFFFRRFGIAVEQRFDGNHEAGRTVAALRAAPVTVGFLYGGQRAVVGNAFNRSNFRAWHLIVNARAAHGQHGAAQRGNSVDEHGRSE